MKALGRISTLTKALKPEGTVEDAGQYPNIFRV